MAETVPPRLIVWLSAGFVIWSSGLVMLYGIHHVGCRLGWEVGAVRLVLVVILVLHAAPIAWMWRYLARRTPRDPSNPRTRGFLTTLALWSTVTALAATVLTLGPPLLLTACV